MATIHNKARAADPAKRAGASVGDAATVYIDPDRAASVEDCDDEAVNAPVLLGIVNALPYALTAWTMIALLVYGIVSATC